MKFYNDSSLFHWFKGCRLMKLSKHTKDHRTFQSEKKKKNLKKYSEIGTEMFSPDRRKKQMRDLKAKPAVSTLKTVHTNYFPEGVSTLFPNCCQQSQIQLQESVLTSTPRECSASHFHFDLQSKYNTTLVFHLNAKHDTIVYCMYRAATEMQSIDTNQEQCNCRGTMTPCLKQSDYIDVFIYWMCSGLS